MSLPSVYLAGPISGCNPEQKHLWRDDLKRGFGDEFRFIDPTDTLIGAEGSDYDVVQADADAMSSADAVFAYMWRESIGTAFGIVNAHAMGKIVCVCDPNHLQSRMLAFYADSVDRTIPHALNSIRTFLRSQSLITNVEKSDGQLEPFQREKLAQAVRKACMAAQTGDVVPTRAIVSRALAILLGDSLEERTVPSASIKEAIWEAMANLASDPSREADFDAIRLAWERYDQNEPGSVATAATLDLPVVHEHPLEVRFRTSGTHSTIWGAVGKISTGAHALMKEILRVDGITDVIFRQFQNTGAPPVKPHVRLQASKTPHVIEGRIYDKGPKGTLQTFQICVANPSSRDAVLNVLRDHLVSTGHMRATNLEGT